MIPTYVRLRDWQDSPWRLMTNGQDDTGQDYNGQDYNWQDYNCHDHEWQDYNWHDYNWQDYNLQYNNWQVNVQDGDGQYNLRVNIVLLLVRRVASSISCRWGVL